MLRFSKAAYIRKQFGYMLEHSPIIREQSAGRLSSLNQMATSTTMRQKLPHNTQKHRTPPLLYYVSGLIQKKQMCSEEKLYGCSSPLFLSFFSSSVFVWRYDIVWKTNKEVLWNQPSFEESVIAHWSSFIAPKMYRGSSDPPKRRDVHFIAHR